MKIRNVVWLTVAVPGLVMAVAAPGRAAARQVVTFDGVAEIVADGTLRTVDLCFLATGSTCLNGEPAGGKAAGPAVDTAPGAGLVDGLQATVRYRQSCAAGVLAPGVPVSTTLSVRTHSGSGWAPQVDATWIQTGQVAVISGGVTGVVLVTPAEAGSCAQPMRVRLTGTVELPG